MLRFARVLRFSSFRYLFLGQAASVVGDRVVIVALGLYIVGQLGTPTDLGLVLGVQAATLVGLLLIGGVWADRLPRHRLMIVTDLLRAVLHGLLAVLILTGRPAIWELVVIEAGFGACQAFFEPAYTGLVPQTVPEEYIQDARALTQTAANLAMLLGPAIATALVVGVGAGEAFAFDAATFLLSAALLLRVHPRSRGTGELRARLTRELAAGFEAIRERSWVWVTVAVYCGALMCCMGPWFVLAPAVARDAYGATSTYGVVSVVEGVGALAGALAGIVWRPRLPLRTGMLISLTWPLLNVVFALGVAKWLLFPLAVLSGFGFSAFLIWWETALAEHIPAHMLSRVSAYDWTGSLVLLPVGYVVSGPLGAALGRTTVLAGGGILAMLLLALGLIPRSTRKLQSLSYGPRARA